MTAGLWNWTGFLGELVECRGNASQLASYAGVLAGVRRSLDDWLPADRMETFARMLACHGLHCGVDCVFVEPSSEDWVPGAARVPTTCAEARRWMGRAGTGEALHVFVSSRQDWLEEALASGWYGMAVAGRMVRKPRIDHQRLGVAFGYPPCCIAFFLEYNDWPRWNTVIEAERRTRVFRWQANFLLRHTPWMGPFHLPCAFDCETTRVHTTDLLTAVADLDSGYALRIARALRCPVLVVSEVMVYVLLRATLLPSGRVRYHTAIPVGGKVRSDRFAAALARGNEIAIADGTVYVFSRGRLVRVLDADCDAGTVEVPRVLFFEGD